jgi:hypothetical protein
VDAKRNQPPTCSLFEQCLSGRELGGLVQQLILGRKQLRSKFCQVFCTLRHVLRVFQHRHLFLQVPLLQFLFENEIGQLVCPALQSHDSFFEASTMSYTRCEGPVISTHLPMFNKAIFAGAFGLGHGLVGVPILPRNRSLHSDHA